ncbi:MAG TPA: lipocalin-like domain-containing protein, partial [Vicinamibacterales bacterium]
MRAFVFSLSIGISALGAASGVLAQRDGAAVSPSAARAAYSRFAAIYKLIATEGRGYLAYDPAGYVSMTTQGPDQPSPAGMRGYAAYFGTFAVNDAASTITHQIFGALQPRFSVTDQVQRFTMAGNLLTLGPPAAAHGSQSSLTWERVPDLPNLTPTHRQLIGFWKLVSTERRNTKGDLVRAYPGWTGFIVYAASGH